MSVTKLGVGRPKKRDAIVRAVIEITRGVISRQVAAWKKQSAGSKKRKCRRVVINGGTHVTRVHSRGEAGSGNDLNRKKPTIVNCRWNQYGSRTCPPFDLHGPFLAIVPLSRSLIFHLHPSRESCESIKSHLMGGSLDRDSLLVEEWNLSDDDVFFFLSFSIADETESIANVSRKRFICSKRYATLNRYAIGNFIRCVWPWCNRTVTWFLYNEFENLQLRAAGDNSSHESRASYEYGVANCPSKVSPGTTANVARDISSIGKCSCLIPAISARVAF